MYSSGACEAYVRAVTAAGKMVEARYVEAFCSLLSPGLHWSHFTEYTYLLHCIKWHISLPLSGNRLIELVRLHGLESDLPEFNMKRKPSKEEYIPIIFKLLATKFDNDIEEVALYLESENKAPVKKGFGARSAGFSAVPTHPP